MKIHKQLNLEPQWITGFTDGEGCFHLSFIKSKTSKLHWGISLEFKISLHEKDINLLKQIKSYFGVDKIHKHGKTSLQFRIRSVKELSVLINHL